MSANLKDTQTLDMPQPSAEPSGQEPVPQKSLPKEATPDEATPEEAIPEEPVSQQLTQKPTRQATQDIPNDALPSTADSSPSVSDGIGFKVAAQFRGAWIEEGRSMNPKLLGEAALTLKQFYRLILNSRWAASILEADIEHSCKTLLDAYALKPEERGTLESLVASEVAIKGHKAVRADKEGGTLGMLWMSRAVNFILTFLEKCYVTCPDNTTSECSRETYDALLKPFHGWLTRKTVPHVLSFCPHRDTITSKMECADTEEAKQQVIAISRTVRPIVEHIQQSLESQDCNFTDQA